MNKNLSYQALWLAMRAYCDDIQAQGARMLKLGQQMIFVRSQLNSDEEVWLWVKANCREIYSNGRERLQDAWDYALECAEERSFAE